MQLTNINPVVTDIIGYIISTLLVILHYYSAEEPNNLQKTGILDIFRKINLCINSND